MTRSHHVVFVTICILLLVSSVPAQQVARDPQAVVLLVQMLAVTGWGASPGDAVAKGTVTQFRGEETVTGAVTLKALGRQGIRVDVETPDGTVSTIRNGSRAAMLQAGKVTAIPGHAVTSQHGLHFLFLTPIATPNDAGTRISYKGTETVNGDDAHVIEIQAVQDPDRPSNPLLQASQFVVYVSTKTFLPIKVDYNRLGGNNPNVVLHCTRYFADYRPIGGLLVPFQQTDFLEGQKIAEIRLRSVQLNVGLADAQFDVPF